MKRITAAVLIMVLALFACCGCGKSSLTFPEDELLSPYRSGKDKEMQVIVETDDAVSVHFFRGETQIYGEIYIPEGKGPFPAVIISGGFATPYYGYIDMGRWLAQNGIVGVVYDPSDMGSMGADPDDFLEWSPLIEAADIESITEAVSGLRYVDDDKIFLWGHSMGGFASAYVGTRNPGLIRGMILIEPAFYLNDEAKEKFPDISSIPEVVPGSPSFGKAYYRDLCSFDIYDRMQDYEGAAVILAGTVSPSMGTDEPEYLTRAAELMPSCVFLSVSGADHYFNGEPMAKVAAYTVYFVNETVKGQDEK